MDHQAVRGAQAQPNVCRALDDGHFALSRNGISYGSLDQCVTAGAMLATTDATQVLSVEQSRFALQLSDSIGESAGAGGWFWPLLGALAAIALLFALRDQRRKRREAYA